MVQKDMEAMGMGLIDLNGFVQGDTTPFICILLLTAVWQPLNVTKEN